MSYPPPSSRSERSRRGGTGLDVKYDIWRVEGSPKEAPIISKLDWAKDLRSELQLRDAKHPVATGCNRGVH